MVHFLIYRIQTEKITHSSRCFFSSWKGNKSWSSTYTIRVTHDLL